MPSAAENDNNGFLSNNCLNYFLHEIIIKDKLYMQRGIIMGYKNVNGLMRHLRGNGIAISGSAQKQQLMNTGYFHGYKGYRFFGESSKRLPFASYSEIYATIQYDSMLKALFYGKIMFIETAVKNVALEGILTAVKSENIQDMYDKVINSYHRAPAGSSDQQRRRFQTNKLKLQNRIHSTLLFAYDKENPKITHFYNNENYSGVPIWALLEILTLGDFGFLLSCLDFDTRAKISAMLGLNTACDTNRELLYKYVYALKDLRNAVAHNDVVFDTRFRKFDASAAMRRCLCCEIGLPYVNFKTICDYLILMCYYLKLLKVPKTEIRAFIREFERIVETYKSAVNPAVAAKVIHPDWPARLQALKNFI